MLTLKKERITSIVNAVIQVFLLANTILVAAGKDPIPLDETALTEALTYILTFAWSFWIWWHNNNMTKAGLKGQIVTNREKALK